MHWKAPQNLTLLEALTLQFPESSKSSLRSWLKEARISVNGTVVQLPHFTINQGDELALSPKKRTLEKGLLLLYEDEDLVVVDKPAGLLSVATAFEEKETVHAILKRHYRPKKVYVVHRLDQETSGIFLFALTEKAYHALKKLFEIHQLERCYTAVVEGMVTSSSGTWRSYLHEDASYYVHSSPDPSQNGELAITHFTLQKQSKHYSTLQLKLETGKKNQIRVQCRDAGYPIVGDKKYGAVTNPLKRLCLHAHLLAFAHPTTGKLMRFESPVPFEL